MTDPALGDIEARLYAELRRIAGAVRGGGATQRTSLVHEAWLRLADSPSVRVQDRDHLLALAARAMRHLLVDRARRASALKRGDGWERVELDGVGHTPHVVDVLVLDQALARLEASDERAARLAELRLIAGMGLPEAASVLGVSLRTAERDWRAARAFLVAVLELG